jgi:integrase
MQIERTKGNEVKVWLSEDEAEATIEVASDRSKKHEVVIRGGLKMGLRSKEWTLVRPEHMHQQEGAFFLRIPDSKDTRQGGSGKSRDAYLPRAVEHSLLRLQSQEGLDDDDHFFTVHKSRIRQMVMEVADDVASAIESGENYPGRAEDWRNVSSHDLRRYFAQTALRRLEMDPGVVMATGGWDSMQALSPYLTKPTPEEVVEEFQSVEWN